MNIMPGLRYGRAVFFVIIVLSLFIIAGDIPAQQSASISMDFQQAALKDVLKIFSQQAGLNFVATDNIEDKKITLYLDGVTVQDALDSIMKANNLGYDQAEGSAVFIVKELGKARVDLVTRVYNLDFARISVSDEGATGDTSNIESIIDNLLSKGPDGNKLGSIVIDQRTNSLIVTTIASDFFIIEDTIAKLDSITPQALIEAEIVEIQTGALKKLGLEWGGADGTFVRFTGPTKITHFPFVRESNPFSKSLLGNVTTTDSTSTVNDVTTTGTNISQIPILGVLSLEEFSMVLRAMENEGTAHYLAKPRIMTVNNQTAEIKITADTAIGVKKTSVSDTGEVIVEAERMETGITLKVTPTINQKGYITMTIEPEVSRATQSAYFTNFVDPTKRSAKTTVMVKDGQTMAIGGLLKNHKEDTNRKVPGLSSIPFLGNMFQSKNNRSVQTEIIVFVTAHAILSVGDAVDAASGIRDAGSKSVVAEKDAAPADMREAEIKKTVMRLRKKREVQRDR